MKNLVFTLLLTSMPFLTQKTEAQESNDVLVNYETMPEYPGGSKKWKQDSEAYMETRLRNMFPQANPDSLATNEKKRRIVVQCIIDKEGKAQNPVILPGHELHPVLDEVAISYVHQMPRVKPGEFKGKPVDVKYTIPLFIHPYYLRLLERGEKPLTTPIAYEVVEKMPEYPGGVEQYMKACQDFAGKYIKKHFPDNNPYYGAPHFHCMCIVKFIVHEDGHVTDAVIVRSADEHNDRAAILFVKSMPRWIPGEQNGRMPERVGILGSSQPVT